MNEGERLILLAIEASIRDLPDQLKQQTLALLKLAAALRKEEED